jgi:hypothetical protein
MLGKANSKKDMARTIRYAAILLLMIIVGLLISVSIWGIHDLGATCYTRIKLGMTEQEVRKIIREVTPEAIDMGTSIGGAWWEQRIQWHVEQEFTIRVSFDLHFPNKPKFRRSA